MQNWTTIKTTWIQFPLQLNNSDFQSTIFLDNFAQIPKTPFMKRIRLFLIAIFMATISLYSQTVDIPDKAFLNALIEEGVDTSGDGHVSLAEARSISHLDIGGNWNEGQRGEIKSLEGIEAFINLDTLRCNYNQLSHLDLSNNVSLTYLQCNDNQLTILNIAACKALLKLNCRMNQLSSLDMGACDALTRLDCDNNLLSSLDLSNKTSLVNVQCWENRLTILDVSACDALTKLDCDFNKLTSLDLSKNTSLEQLKCRMNELSSLDVSVCNALTELECEGNRLTTLDVSNNSSLKKIILRNNPDLYKICVWTLPFPPEGVRVVKSGCPNALFTTDCNQ